MERIWSRGTGAIRVLYPVQKFKSYVSNIKMKIQSIYLIENHSRSAIWLNYLKVGMPLNRVYNSFCR